MNKKVYQLNSFGTLKESDDFHEIELLDEDLTAKFREGLVKLSVEEALTLTTYTEEELTKCYKEEFSRVFVYKNNLTEFKSIAIMCTNSDGEFLVILPNKYTPNYDIMTDTQYWYSSKYKRAMSDIDIFKINIDENIKDFNNSSRNPELKYTFIKIGYDYGDSISLPIPLEDLNPDNPKSEERIKNILKIIEENLKKLVNNMKETNDILNK